MQNQIIGWDVGGAHLKAARLNEDGRVEQVIQQPCPLWMGLERLYQALAEVLHQLPTGNYVHAVTMTGELVDCFDSREQGVHSIVHALRETLGHDALLIYAGCSGFLKADAVVDEHVMNIASANWLASASLAATMQRDALFVDMGSTTTDVLLINNHRLCNTGYSDYQRLVSGELLYTGVVRTAVMAIAQTAQFNGQHMGLMAEYFATMADVYRVTGDLNEAHDQTDTADGAEKTPMASARRLSRMTGYEFDAKEWSLWLAFAQHLKQRQQQLVLDACFRQLQRSLRPEKMSLVGAGIGRFMLKDIAADLGLAYRGFTQFVPVLTPVGDVDAADCAPAVAVAYLAGKFG